MSNRMLWCIASPISAVPGMLVPPQLSRRYSVQLEMVDYATWKQFIFPCHLQGHLLPESMGKSRSDPSEPPSYSCNTVKLVTPGHGRGGTGEHQPSGSLASFSPRPSSFLVSPLWRPASLFRASIQLKSLGSEGGAWLTLRPVTSPQISILVPAHGPG